MGCCAAVTVTRLSVREFEVSQYTDISNAYVKILRKFFEDRGAVTTLWPDIVWLPGKEAILPSDSVGKRR
jgi:hypothetical protein